MNMSVDPHSPSVISARLFTGIGVVFLGILVLLDNFFPNHGILDFWPLIIVAIGVGKLVQSRWEATSGYVILAVGLFLQLLCLGVDKLIGPLILVAIGVFIVLHALRHHRQVPPELLRSEDFLRGTAILSAYKQRVMSQTFKGGELTAMFGGFHVDLRQAALESNTARLDVFVLFGGGEIRVPQGWDVQVQATAIAGAIDNKVTPNPTTGDETRPRLVITGQALFGGVEIKD